MALTRRARRFTFTAAGLTLLVVAGAVTFRLAADHIVFTEACTARAGGTTVRVSLEQAGHAATIAAIATRRDLPARATTIALVTALQESKLRNLDHGDRDSLGLFQQRPSQGWGNKNLVRTPTFSAAAFYVPLVQTPGWRSMPVTKAAQVIQRSAYPDRYAQWELAAATLVKGRLKVPDSALNCKRR